MFSNLTFFIKLVLDTDYYSQSFSEQMNMFSINCEIMKPLFLLVSVFFLPSLIQWL